MKTAAQKVLDGSSRYALLQGDCLSVLKTLAVESIHCAITSPPYWGLRDHGTGRWEGGAAGCEHKGSNGQRIAESAASVNGGGHSAAETGPTPMRSICSKCGATRIDQQIGLEETIPEFVAKMVAVFREVRRVLRDDGTLWLNLGDSYSNDSKWGGYSSGKNYTSALGGCQGQRTRRGKDCDPKRGLAAPGQPMQQGMSGLKPKDLCGIPWRVALALQADGWYLRSDIIWAKPNPMPESVTDRPTKAHEYLFLLSKSQRYHYDAEAILEPVSKSTHARLSQDVQAQIGSERANGGKKTNGTMKAVGRKLAPAGSGIKNNSDFDAAMAIMPDERNRRSVWTVGTTPFKKAHFATFPPKLIEPCILAGCPEGGTVLDPFSGAGTTVMVALEHNRRAIGIELNPAYNAMARKRISKVTPMALLADAEAAP